MQGLLQQLRRTLDLHHGSRALLAAVVAVIDSLPLDLRVLGGSVQLRAGGQENLATLDAESRPSATLRRAVEAAGEAVLLDVVEGRLLTAASGFTEGTALGPRDFASRSVLRACHHLGLPLRGRAGVEGILILEVQADDPAVLVHPLEQLQLLADCAVPLLEDLPPARAPGTISLDPLPVAGTRLRTLLAALTPFAATLDPLLIVGEPGVGRSLVARWIHLRSPMRQERLQPVSGPDRARALFGEGDTRGLLEQRRGTLFIDGVAQLDAASQDALADVLETGKVRRRGSHDARRVGVRLLFGADAATVDEGLRPALAAWFRGQRVDVPPLRERTDELAGWVDHFLERGGGSKLRLDDSARAWLATQAWPGNLKEIERFCGRLLTRIDPGTGRSVVLGAEDLRGVLLPAGEVADPLELLENTARTLLSSPSAQGRMLDLAAALPQMVLLLAEARWGRTEAAQRFGLAQAVSGDNHHRLFRKARKAIDDLKRDG
ncbi:MAG: sigma 54-interacting transcriptional regulator [bacterium]